MLNERSTRTHLIPVLTLLLAGGCHPLAGQAPSFRDATGHAFGERITLHHEMARYLQRLAETSDRVRIERVGESWERRPFWVAIVTSPENHARLEEIRAGALRLADPRGGGASADERLVPELPAVVWLGGSIHGFELSGSEGVLRLLEHLTTRSDPATLEVLRNVVVLMDPMLNPDGRDAFAQLNHERIGRIASSDEDDWSNDFTGWQGTQYRTGHYFFDTNRDWFAQTQPETRDRVAFLRRWAPQVAVDLHEMGANAEFYFDPPGDPTNPNLPAFTSRWFGIFGAAYAQAFDSAGFEYMTRERYNYFYPGYTSHRGYQGAVAMLFEQGSTRGLALGRGDGSVRTLADALEQQYVAAWTTTRVAATRRADLLREYAASQRAVVTDAPPGPVRYVMPPDAGDPTLTRELLLLLDRNGVEIGVTGGEIRLPAVTDRGGAAAGARAFPAGSYVFELRQPAGRLLRTLLAPETPLPREFLVQARAYVDRAENPRFYDITAWSLPLLFNLTMYGTTDARVLPVTRWSPPAPAVPAGAAVAGVYAYLLDGAGAGTPAALHALRAAGHRVAVLTRASRFGGRPVASGSGIVRVGQNDPSATDAVVEVARRYGIAVTAMPSGLSDSGFPALGSGDHTFNLKPARVGLLSEDGIQGYSFGWAWYTLDRQYEIPLTVLRTRAIAATKLERFATLVIPEVSRPAFEQAVGDSGLARLAQWVRDGGTLITIGSATDVARAQFNLALRSWYDTGPGQRATRYDVPGAVFRAELDLRHWMSAGYAAAELPVLVDSDRLYLAPDRPPSTRRRVVATYAASRPRMAGHAWPETLERIPGAVFVYEERVGAGRVIAFAEEPNFRAYHRGLNRLFLNAVVLGPSAP
jgi:hypothetical protein